MVCIQRSIQQILWEYQSTKYFLHQSTYRTLKHISSLTFYTELGILFPLPPNPHSSVSQFLKPSLILTLSLTPLYSPSFNKSNFCSCFKMYLFFLQSVSRPNHILPLPPQSKPLCSLLEHCLGLLTGLPVSSMVTQQMILHTAARFL